MLNEFQIVDLLTTLMIGSFTVLLAYSPLPRSIGQAIAHRLMHGKTERDRDPAAEARIEAVADEMAMLRRQLEETQGRLDFAERMLAQGKARAELPGARD